MCPLRRVEDHHAGPSALGILVPPGRRTFLIVRPRSLPWDLLLLRPDSATAFHELYREQAGRIAEALYEELGNWPKSAATLPPLHRRARANGPRWVASTNARPCVPASNRPRRARVWYCA